MIQPATLDFLIKLKKNNNKEWFDKNRSMYEAAKSNFQEVVNEVIAVKHLETKKCTFPD